MAIVDMLNTSDIVGNVWMIAIGVAIVGFVIVKTAMRLHH